MAKFNTIDCSNAVRKGAYYDCGEGKKLCFGERCLAYQKIQTTKPTKNKSETKRYVATGKLNPTRKEAAQRKRVGC